MPRILAIDYGRKRTGIAVTDPLQISANGMPTIPTHQLLPFLEEYCQRESVEKILVGLPKQMNGLPSESEQYITPFLKQLAKKLPNIPVERVDERFTSTIAHREMLAGGFRKSQRQQKGRADEMAATLILTTWLESRSLFF